MNLVLLCRNNNLFKQKLNLIKILLSKIYKFKKLITNNKLIQKSL
jgi:hypothetical protein